jgi:hypothetical protein
VQPAEIIIDLLLPDSRFLAQGIDPKCVYPAFRQQMIKRPNDRGLGRRPPDLLSSRVCRSAWLWPLRITSATFINLQHRRLTPPHVRRTI